MGLPDKTSPNAFTQDLFLRGGLSASVVIAVRTDFRPEVAKSPEDIVLTLLPSDGHLEWVPRGSPEWRPNYLIAAGRSIRPDCLPFLPLIGGTGAISIKG